MPLFHAHAHNDYKHRHPLADAMACGFTSFEADVFLKNGKLIVAHISPMLKHRTLEELYLRPMYDSVMKHNGTIYNTFSEPVILLIDVKTDATDTYSHLKPLLEKYAAVLTFAEEGVIHERAITIILSGNKPYEILKNEKHRLAFIDESFLNVPAAAYDSTLCPLASTKYSNLLSWRGKGEINNAEKENLLKLIAAAHADGKKIRLWASPENEIVWKQLLDYGIDFISTDDMEGLRDFLMNRK